MRWESFGGNGTSGTLQCVVNQPASEHEPRTELYIADTLKNTEKTPNIKKHERVFVLGNIRMILSLKILLKKLNIH